MKLSIIIPTFNRLAKLERLIKTIPEDSRLEVIVVDDASDVDLERLYGQHTRLTLLTNSRGKGAGGARNTGLACAKGDYILFADSDDVFLPDFTDTVFKYIELGGDIVYFAPQSFLEENPSAMGCRHRRYKKLVEKYISGKSDDLRYYFYVPWSKLVRRELLVSNDIEFEEVSASNDVNFSLAVGLKSEIIHASLDAIYSVEEGKESLTKESSTSKLVTRIEVVHRFNATLMDNGLKNKRVMIFPWLYKLFLNSPLLGVKYLIKSFYRRTPLIIDRRFKN